ncbi:MAG: hypothetical protein OK422_03220 [Thaumarchaeota archaeon]|nr:hypothetical protein [Nitrososphaerota archaeon]
MIKRTIESVLGRIQKVERSIARRGLLSNAGRWVQLLYILALVLFAGGLINATVQPVNQNFVIFPGRGAQSISETVINSFAILLGAAGVYVTYLSGRQTTKPRMVNFYLILALMLIGSAMYIGIYVYSSKG